MPCTVVKFGSTTGIVCSRGQRTKRCRCGEIATRECDWRVKDRKSGTCDRPLCERCTHEPAPEKDLCKEHAALWEARGSRPAAPGGEPPQPDLFGGVDG